MNPVDDDFINLPAPHAVLRLGRGLLGVPSGPTRRAYLRDRLRDVDDLPWVRVVACAQREAAVGTLEARVILDELGALLESGDFDERRTQWSEAAEFLCEHGAMTLLGSEGAEPYVPDIRNRDAPKGSLAYEGETLGRRKTLGRTASGDTLDRLVIDPHPDVIENVLKNPRLKEVQVVQLASRDRVTGAILKVIAASKWQYRPSVRAAVAKNPRCPPQIACRLVTNMTKSDLLEIAHDQRLTEEVRAAARASIEAKPPRVVDV